MTDSRSVISRRSASWFQDKILQGWPILKYEYTVQYMQEHTFSKPRVKRSPACFEACAWRTRTHHNNNINNNNKERALFFLLACRPHANLHKSAQPEGVCKIISCIWFGPGGPESIYTTYWRMRRRAITVDQKNVVTSSNMHACIARRINGCGCDTCFLKLVSCGQAYAAAIIQFGKYQWRVA